jgi:pantoate--beta-alanine ligase
MYPEGYGTSIDVGPVAVPSKGAARPGHFAGVATVVLKLFEIVQADRSYFGEKDAQQLAVIRRLVADFNVPTTIVGVPTVREPDGLAMSSRNRRLDASERQLAPALYHALQRVQHAIESGVTSASDLKRLASEQIPSDARLRLEYFEIVEPINFQPVEHVTGPIVAAGALWVGTTRLIDNIRCVPGI